MVDNIDSDEFILELNLFLGKMYVNEEKGILSPEDLEGREVIFNIFIRPKINFLNSYLLKFKVFTDDDIKCENYRILFHSDKDTNDYKRNRVTFYLNAQNVCIRIKIG